MKNRVLWFTGLSGSGKSTLANKLFDHLTLGGNKAVILDGDAIRSKEHNNLDFSPEGIVENNKLIIDLCIKYLQEYNFVLVSVIAPFCKVRKLARKLIGNAYTEIYVKSSLETVIKRDTKGLYSKALKNEIKNFIGIDPNVPFQEPDDSDIIINTESQNETQSFNTLLKKIFD